MAVATLLIGFLVGGAAGYYGRFFTEPARGGGDPAGMGSKMSAGGSRGSRESQSPEDPGASRGTSAGGSAGLASRPPVSPANALVQTVCGLDVLAEKGELSLAPDQKGRLLALLKELHTAESLSREACATHLQTLQDLLTAEEKKAVQEAGASFGSGQGGGLNPEKPFSMGPPAQRLKDLLGRLEQ